MIYDIKTFILALKESTAVKFWTSYNVAAIHTEPHWGQVAIEGDFFPMSDIFQFGKFKVDPQGVPIYSSAVFKGILAKI